MKGWTGNKKSTFVTLGASNHTDKEREANDFYATDPIAIDKLIAEFEIIPLHRIWECACGTGCLSERLKYFGYDVISSDIVDRGYGEVKDFLGATDMPDDCQCILTNPPYKYASEFIKHSLELLPDGGLCFMFLKTTFLEGQKRYDEIFNVTPPTLCHAVLKEGPVRKERRLSENEGRRRFCRCLCLVRVEKGLQG